MPFDMVFAALDASLTKGRFGELAKKVIWPTPNDRLHKKCKIRKSAKTRSVRFLQVPRGDNNNNKPF